MAKADFNDLLWFLVVANERSFTKAAAKLGIAHPPFVASRFREPLAATAPHNPNFPARTFRQKATGIVGLC